MPVVPVPPIFVDGPSDTSTFNQLSDAVKFLIDKPACRLRQTVAQTLSSSVWTPVTFDVEELDANVAAISQHSTSSSTSRFTSAYPAWYSAAGGVGFSNMNTPAGRRGVRWSVNATTVNGSAVLYQVSNSSSGAIAARSILVYLNEGDYLEMSAFFEGGGTLDTEVASADRQSTMSVYYVRRAG